MARTPTVYRWDDSGAPDLNAIMPTTNDKNRLWMHTVLKACLVDGYGSKAAAGWTMPHEEITDAGCRFVLKNAANSGAFLYEGGGFSGSSNLSVNTLWVADDIVGMDSPINAWSYNSSYAERSAAGGFHNLAGALGQYWGAWMVVANENTAIVYCLKEAGSFDISSGYSVVGGYESRLFIGAADQGAGVSVVDAGNFLICGGGVKSSISSSTQWSTAIDGVASWTKDVIGLDKVSAHGMYLYQSQLKKVSINPAQFIPVPLLISQYGSSGSQGSSSSHLYHLAALIGLRQLGIQPVSMSGWNSWLSSEGAQYGVPFNFAGSLWVAVKYLPSSVELVCLDAAEWGG